MLLSNNDQLLFSSSVFTGNHRIISCQLTNHSLLSNHYGSVLESSILPRCTKVAQYSTTSKIDSASQPESSKDCNVPEKVSVFQKMKQLAKDYWHILIPVHCITSIGWAAIFYTAVKKYVAI